MAATTVRLSTYSNVSGARATVDVPQSRVKKVRQQMERDGVIITGSRLIRS